MKNILHRLQRIVSPTVIVLLYQLYEGGNASAFSCTSSYRQQDSKSLLRKNVDRLVRIQEPPLVFATNSIRSLEKSIVTKLHSTTVKFKNFDTMLDAYRDETVVVYFSSNLCGSCRLQKKELVNIRHRLFGLTTNINKNILTIDADVFPQVCLRYDITKLPCILLVKNGVVLLRLDGFTTADDLIQRIQTTTTITTTMNVDHLQP